MRDISENMKTYKRHRYEKIINYNNYQTVNLSSCQEKDLIKAILNLPIDRQNLLVFYKYYKHSFDEIEEILDIENPNGEYLHLVIILSEIIGLNTCIISNNSMEKVCKEIVKISKIKLDSDLNYLNMKPNVNKFTKKRYSIVATIFLFFALLLGVDAYANGKVFEWVVSTFEKYSVFNVDNENVIDKDNLTIKMTYIPNNFILEDKSLSESIDHYYYVYDDKFLAILFVYEDTSIYIDTENAEKNEFDINENHIITWKKESENYFVFSKGDVGCQVYGNIEKEEFIKVYNGIFIEKK